jgi:ATP-binding cassette, subfamily C, bacteriocin exporter
MPRKICIKQHDITDCGAACLATVAWYHNLKIPISRIRQYAKTDRKGTNVLGMVQAAQQLGFTAQGVRGTPEALKEIPFPAVAHVVLESGLHHFVVIFKVTDKYVELADPARGLEKRPREQFLKEWTGVLVLLTPHLEFQQGDKRESVWHRFAQLLKPYPSLIVEALISAVVYTILGFGTALYVEHLMDSVFPTGNEKLLHVLGIGMALILVFRFVFSWARSSLLVYLAQKIDATLILGYYKHILRLPQSFFDTRRVGEIISRINDAVKIREAISSASLTIIVDALILVFSFALMFVYSWKLAAVAALTLPLFILLFFALKGVISRTQRGMMEKNAELEAQLVSSVSGIATIKSQQAEAASHGKIEQQFVELLRLVRRASYLGITNATVSELISGGALLALLWIGGWFVVNHRLSLGEVMSLYTLIGYVTGPASRLVGIHQTVQDAVIAADRLFEILTLETEDEEHSKNGVGLDIDMANVEELHIENLSYRYGNRAKILDDITLTIKRGTMTAIVGESGSGKSTIAKLLQGMYEPTEGTIRFVYSDNTSFSSNNLRLDALRRFIGSVPQDVELFHGTVLDNITLGDMQPDYTRAMQICHFIGANEFIQHLPYQWNTVLGEFGADLSGGQRQRLALARALYRAPRLLVLDEATSALDSESEFTVQQALNSLREQGLTVLAIAHRLSTIAGADQILVMDKGRIVERGTHTELLMQEGKYYALWMRQTQVSAGYETGEFTRTNPHESLYGRA